ncbi:MAG: TfoX/Sxy family protein [Acidimicrobiales bacterium]
MKIPKPTDADKDYFLSLFDDRLEVELRPMFGNVAAFVADNSQMCAGLFGPLVGLRLGDTERAELAAVDGAGPFGPEDRPMKEYVAMPEQWRVDHDDVVEQWIERAIAHTASLPPKKKKAKKKGANS